MSDVQTAENCAEDTGLSEPLIMIEHTTAILNFGAKNIQRKK